MRARSVTLGLSFAGAGLGGALAGILALGDLRESAAAFLGLFAAAFAAYAAAIWLARRAPGAPRAAGAVVAAGALFRALLLPAEPTLSDDLYRYVWDGRVQAAGLNPFAHAPSAPALAPLRDAEVHPRINHPDVRTIYPPLAQLAFLAARGPLDSPRGMKVLFAFLDVGTSLVLWRLLSRRGTPLWVIAHAWNPLCIVEFAHSGHMDSLPLFLLAFALERSDAGRPAWAALALGLSAAAKFFALALLPFFARRWRPAWLATPAILAALYLPYAGAGAHLVSGLGTYAASWRFNDSAFAFLEGSVRAAFAEESYPLPVLAGHARAQHAAHVAAKHGGEPFDLGRVLEAAERRPAELLRELRDGGDRVTAGALAHLVAQGIALVLLALLVGVLWLRRVPLEAASLATVAGGLVLAAAVQPWYVSWLVPLAALRPSFAALAWSGSVALAYAVYLRPPGAPWEVPLPFRVAEYAIPVVVAAIAFWARRRRRTIV